MKKTLRNALMLAVLGASALGMTSCGTNFEDNTIKIGLTGPLTGGAAAYGIAVKNSVELAVKEINGKGGVNGYNLSYVALDDELNSEKAGNNYATLKKAGMQVSLGGVTSGCCLEFNKYAKADNVFSLTPSATNKDVPTEANAYQMCFSDPNQGTAAAQYIEENYPDAKVGMLYDSSDDYSKGIHDKFVAEYDNDVIVTSFTSDNKTSFTAQITDLKDCNFVFLPIYYTEASIFISQAKGTISDDAVYFGCDGLDGIDTVDGFVANSYKQEISYLTHFDSEDTVANAIAKKTEITYKTAKVDHYITSYKAQYDATSMNQFGASAYDCVYAITQALTDIAAADKNAVTPDTSASDLCEALKKQFQSEDFKFTGVTGEDITWAEDGTVQKIPAKYVVNPNRKIEY